jgi:vitamin B12 transporter
MLFRSSCIAAVAAMSVCHAQAQSPDAQQIVVTGNRVPVALSQLLSDVVVLDETVLRDAAGRSLDELLRDHAGLQLSRNGGPGQSTGLFVRGASMSNTVVLVDGVRIGSATLGQAALEGLSLAGIERIEVLRGVGSALYGADAVGGVIQIFTRQGKADASRWQAAVHRGGYGSSQASASGSARWGAVDAAASVSRDASDGVSAVASPGGAFGSYNPDADGFRRGSANAQLGLNLSASQRVGLQALESRLNSQYDATDLAGDSSPDFRNRLTTRTVALTHSVAEPALGFRSDLQWSQSDDDLRTGAVVVDRFNTQRDALSWQPNFRWGAATLTGVLETHRTDVRSTSFVGERRRSRNDALGASAFGTVDVHRWQIDLRRDKHDVYGSQTTGKLAYAWQAAPPVMLRASVGTAFRAPSFNELYFPSFGVESIRPERARSAELGMNLRGQRMQAQLTLYRNRVLDLVGYQSDPTACPPGYDFGCAANINRALLKGASASVTGHDGPWRWRAALEYLDARDSDSGSRLVRRARHNGSAELAYQAASWGAAASVTGVGNRLDGGSQLSAYELLDLSAHWQAMPQLRFEAKLLNALDRRYEPVKDYGALGRQAWLGLRYDTQGL